MTAKLTSYINFNGNAKEAAEFYKTIFGGELHMDTFEKYADSMPVEEADRGKVMHAYLKGEAGVELMMSDTPSSMKYEDGARVSLALSGDDDAILRGYWKKLGEGGTVAVPLATSPWGDTFGMVTDKFGVGWMVDISAARP
jgi:PhnB protein